MSDERGPSAGTIILAFIAGAVAGAAVALLTSPKSGNQVRETLKGWTTDGRARRAVERATQAARGAFDDVVGGGS